MYFSQDDLNSYKITYSYSHKHQVKNLNLNTKISVKKILLKKQVHLNNIKEHIIKEDVFL